MDDRIQDGKCAIKDGKCAIKGGKCAFSCKPVVQWLSFVDVVSKCFSFLVFYIDLIDRWFSCLIIFSLVIVWGPL